MFQLLAFPSNALSYLAALISLVLSITKNDIPQAILKGKPVSIHLFDNLHQNMAKKNKGGYVIPTTYCNMPRIFKGKKNPL